MATTISTTPPTGLQPGARVTVRHGSGEDTYIVTGKFVGFIETVRGRYIRVLPDDQLGRRVPMPAQVTIHA